MPELSPLVKLRSERDLMSAIERRIADFILDNALLLRDYSSQQLASAIGISQSSVVKFCQKLGFKGYPDLKYSIGEAAARADSIEDAAPARNGREPADEPAASSLWRLKSGAEAETRLINSPEALAEVARTIGSAGKAFIIGLGEDDIHARAFALRLSLLGIVVVHNFDTAHMTASVSAADADDVLLVFSEHGKQPALSGICRYFQARQGRVITVTRHSSNALRAHANLSLLVSAHDERAYIEPLLYHNALQQLLDVVFVLLCEADPERRANLETNLDRIRPMPDP